MNSSLKGQDPAPDLSAAADARATVTELLERRVRLAEWLARLDEVPSTNPRAADRVRADYRQRLETVMSELSEHREALRDKRRRLASSLASAEEAEQSARDALDEAELRFRIGEIESEEWEEKRSSLEQEAESARGAVREAREEAARLDEVLDSLEGGIDTVPSPGAATPGGRELPAADGLAPEDATADAPDQASDLQSSDEGGAADEDGFLQELDRAIEASADTRPRAGAKCPECGYTNDFDAWYCGVCGVDLA